jgi:hypothetical protein
METKEQARWWRGLLTPWLTPVPTLFCDVRTKGKLTTFNPCVQTLSRWSIVVELDGSIRLTNACTYDLLRYHHESFKVWLSRSLAMNHKMCSVSFVDLVFLRVAVSSVGNGTPITEDSIFLVSPNYFFRFVGILVYLPATTNHINMVVIWPSEMRPTLLQLRVQSAEIINNAVFSPHVCT